VLRVCLPGESSAVRSSSTSEVILSKGPSRFRREGLGVLKSTDWRRGTGSGLLFKASIVEGVLLKPQLKMKYDFGYKIFLLLYSGVSQYDLLDPNSGRQLKAATCGHLKTGYLQQEPKQKGCRVKNARCRDSRSRGLSPPNLTIRFKAKTRNHLPATYVAGNNGGWSKLSSLELLKFHLICNRNYSKRENPRLCRGGSNSLTFPGVCPGFLFWNVGL
jgi:hypothetical protein